MPAPILSELRSQDAARRTIERALETGRVHHAYLFAGPDGVGKELAAFGLAACVHLPVRSLSQGQKRRSALARLALSGEAPLWILDEPFAALDADAVQHLEQLVLAQVGSGGSVIFTTHQQAAITARATQHLDLDEMAEAAC